MLVRAIYAQWHDAPPHILGVGHVMQFTPYLWASEWQYAQPSDLVNLPTQSVGHMILAHALEVSDIPDMLLAEVARVLDGMGHVLIIVPNYRGIWANSDTPFNRQNGMRINMLVQVLGKNRLQLRAMRPVLLRAPMRLSYYSEVFGRYLWAWRAGAWVIAACKIIPSRPQSRWSMTPPHMQLKLHVTQLSTQNKNSHFCH